MGGMWPMAGTTVKRPAPMGPDFRRDDGKKKDRKQKGRGDHMAAAPFVSFSEAAYAATRAPSGRAALACAMMALNAPPSCIAMSASTLRSSSMPASFRPCMNTP